VTTRTDDLRLAEPSVAYGDEIAAFRAEALADAPHIPGGSELEDFPDPATWVAQCQSLTDPAALPPGYVPGEQWMLVRRDQPRILGLVNIRLSIDNDYLREYGGHIGYVVRPSERHRGYGRAQLLLALHRCQAVGLDRVLITCDVGNEASRRLIVSCGGVFERVTSPTPAGETMERYWVEP